MGQAGKQAMALKSEAGTERQDGISTRERILNVTESLCASTGPHQLRHATIARELGIKPPSLYAHFPGMDAILGATTRRALQAICLTYSNVNSHTSAVEALNESQARQVDLLIARPGITRLVLLDLSQPGGAGTVGWDTPEIVEITGVEKRLFKQAVEEGEIVKCDFQLWFSSRMGALYVALSYEWLKSGYIDPARRSALIKYLKIHQVRK